MGSRNRILYVVVVAISFFQIVQGQDFFDALEELKESSANQEITARDVDTPEDISSPFAATFFDANTDASIPPTSAAATFDVASNPEEDPAVPAPFFEADTSDNSAAAASDTDLSGFLSLPGEIDPSLSPDAAASKRSATDDAAARANEIIDVAAKAENKRAPQEDSQAPQKVDKRGKSKEGSETPEEDGKPRKTTVQVQTTTIKPGHREIIFSNSLKANKVRRKYPLAFCSLERDNGIVCPGVRRGHFMEQFYYDEKSNRCMHFVYNGCGGNANRFSTLWECNSSCAKTRKIFT